MRVKWEMAEPMRWSRNSGCELLQRRYPALNMGKYPYRFCESGVPLKCCASDRYSSGWCVVSMKFQQNAQWTVAPSLIPHWMRGILTLLFGGRIFVCKAWG
ncbi:surface protease GP63 [Trypanosoma cruzi]|nr:surface protease GP63 [Trypanosoma cruzi]